MTRTVKRIFFISFLAILAFCISVGYYLYNKGPLDIRNSRGIAVNATDLYLLYSNDSLNANKKYTAEVLLVRGEVSEVSVNSKQEKIILLKTGINSAYVNCTMEEPAENIKPSDKVSLKGICSGIGQGDADLGIRGDVYLTRCLITTAH